MEIDKAHRKRASKERGNKKSLPDSISLGIKKRFVGGQITDALQGISRIEPKIHRIKLSGPYSYLDLVEKLGPLKVDGSFDSIKSPKYWIKAYRQLKDRVLTIYCIRKEPVYPKCFIEFSNPYTEFLIELDRLLPGLNLSSLELTVDIFCRNHEYVQALFWVLKRALLVPFQRSAMQYDGPPSVEIGKRVGMNSTMIIGDVEVYERGADGDKKDGGWTEGECNRVRMEFRAKRRHLKKQGIKTLGDLIKNPRFRQMHQIRNKLLYQFKQGKDSSKVLPHWWDNNFDFFQEEVIKARNGGIKRVTKFMEEAEEFRRLQSWIIFSMNRFDRRWVRQFRVSTT